MLWVDVSVLAVLATQLSGPELAHASALVDEDAEAWSRGQKTASEELVSADLRERVPVTEINNLARPAAYLNQRAPDAARHSWAVRTRRWPSSIGDARCHGPRAQRPGGVVRAG
jgi:hypothetical protein